ncbi:hypothetical protein NBRC116601_11270 [Cognatishimia sp. WU-CL00825]
MARILLYLAVSLLSVPQVVSASEPALCRTLLGVERLFLISTELYPSSDSRPSLAGYQREMTKTQMLLRQAEAQKSLSSQTSLFLRQALQRHQDILFLLRSDRHQDTRNLIQNIQTQTMFEETQTKISTFGCNQVVLLPDPKNAGPGKGQNSDSKSKTSGNPARDSTQTAHGGVGFEISGNLVFVFLSLVAGIIICVIIVERSQRDRRSQRFICFLNAKLAVEKSTIPVKILDLSLLGCKIEFENLPDTKEEVVINIGEIRRKGQIIWRNDVYAGVHFKRRLKQNQLLMLLSAPAKA